MLKQDEIIELAEQAGFTPVETSWHFSTIEAFAKLVDAEATAKAVEREREFWIEQSKVDIEEAIRYEREACAKVCEWYSVEKRANINYSEECALGIRARGQV